MRRREPDTTPCPRRRTVLARIIAAGLATIAFAATSVVAAPEAHAAVVNVSVNTLSYSPKNITITAGDTVKWTQFTEIQHDVVADDGSYVSHPACPPVCLGDGSTWFHTYSEPGFYRYYCTLHGGPGGSGMAGTVTVLETQARSTTVSWSAAELQRLQEVAAYIGESPAEAQRTSVFFLAFLVGLVGDRTQQPQTLEPAGSGAQVTSVWPPSDLNVLAAVQNKYALSDVDAHRIGVYLLSFLLALGGS